MILIAFTIYSYGQITEHSNKNEYVLIIHGGAGYLKSTMPDSARKEITDGINDALNAGILILKEGGTSVDAVEAAIRTMEDNPAFNSGRGGVLNSEGHVDMDASIMDGIDLSCGAVGSVKTVKNPISLAKLVMQKTKHVLLVSEGAEKFADMMGVERRDQSYFIVPERLREWQNSKSKQQGGNTVGAIALDKNGNLAAGTSTGGMLNKMPGRLGDTPIIGAGTYADNATCAVSCTGWGEKFIKNVIAFNISALMQYKSFSLKEAVSEVFSNRLSDGDGGVITLDKMGNYEIKFNTPTMPRGIFTSSGVRSVNIFGNN